VDQELSRHQTRIQGSAVNFTKAAWRRDHTTAAGILNLALTRAHNPAARSLLQLHLPAPSRRSANGAPPCRPWPSPGRQ
jgi:hypothetical protein